MNFQKFMKSQKFMKFQKKIIYSKNPNIKFPYILYIPVEMENNASLIIDLKTPKPMEGDINDIINELLEQEVSYNAAVLMDYFKFPVIIPIIPRINGFYTSYLGSKIIKNDLSELHSNIPEEVKDMFKDIDKQLYYMIKEANEILNLKSKAIINGYSASAKFATGFSVLHPDVISCNISGGTSGLSTLPIKKIGNIDLPYPIGVSDIDFDEENFRDIKHFFYIGEEDNNNPALPLCELSSEKAANGNQLPKRNFDGTIRYKLDVDGKLLPYYSECYSKEEINIIYQLYNENNIKRFKENEVLYKKLGIDSVHKIYPGNHATLFRLNKMQLIKDMISIVTSVKQEELLNMKSNTR